MTEFVDLQQRATNFRLNIRQKEIKSSDPTGDLRSIFIVSDSICKRRQLRPDFEWKEKGFKSDEGKKPGLLVSSGDGIGSNHAYVEEVVQNSWERADVEAERAFINQYILDQTNINDNVHRYSFKGGVAGVSVNSKVSNRVLEKQMELYAKNISNTLQGDCSASIQGAVVEAVETMNDKEVTQLWGSVLPLLSLDSADIDDAELYRDSEKWINFVLQRSTFYLQQMYKEFMETIVESNMELAQRGGVPGVIPLIEAYLNVTLPDFEFQDGVYGKHPVWPVLYNLLRCGELQLAAKVVKTLSSIPNCAVLVGCILNCCDCGLDADKRLKLSAEWKHEGAHCSDPFKRAAYAIFLGVECPEVTDSIENWLWVKLMQCKLDATNGKTQFRKIQTTVCVDCGEDYFVKNGGSYLLYFTALWLTGQIERSIELLYRSGMTHHAVHISILAQQKSLLILGRRVSEFILTQDEKDPIFCRLNFARLLLLYVKNFELENVEYALNYCFFLKDLYFDKETAGGGNIFEGCVSRLCFISHQTDVILGRLTESGDVQPGLIERFKAVVNTSDIINRVARDSDISGETLTACRLFLMIKRANDAFKLCSKHLVSLISQGTSENKKKEGSEETLKLAYWLLGLKNVEPTLDVTLRRELERLIHLNIFSATSLTDPLKALRALQGMKLIPFSNDEMSIRVSDYTLVSDRVKEVMHHVITTLFKVFVQLSRNGSEYSRSDLKQISKVVLLFVAEVNCRFPVHLNSQILQLQSQI